MDTVQTSTCPNTAPPPLLGCCGNTPPVGIHLFQVRAYYFGMAYVCAGGETSRMPRKLDRYLDVLTTFSGCGGSGFRSAHINPENGAADLFSNVVFPGLGAGSVSSCNEADLSTTVTQVCQAGPPNIVIHQVHSRLNTWGAVEAICDARLAVAIAALNSTRLIYPSDGILFSFARSTRRILATATFEVTSTPQPVNSLPYIEKLAIMVVPPSPVIIRTIERINGVDVCTTRNCPGPCLVMPPPIPDLVGYADSFTGFSTRNNQITIRTGACP